MNRQIRRVFLRIPSVGVSCPALQILTLDLFQLNTYKANFREYSPKNFRRYGDKHYKLLV